MANEAAKVELYGANDGGQIQQWACASHVAIAKGTAMKSTDTTPRTAAASTGNLDHFIGFAAAAKSATDLAISIPVWTNGVFSVVSSLAIVDGNKLVTSAPGNVFTFASSLVLAADTSYVITAGTAMESVGNATRFNMRLNK